jgi:ankyrin repeat protein
MMFYHSINSLTWFIKGPFDFVFIFVLVNRRSMLTSSMNKDDYLDFSSGSLTPVESADFSSEISDISSVTSEEPRRRKTKSSRCLDDVAKLHRAARLNQSHAVERILETGIEPDVLSADRKTTAFHEACRLGHKDVVQVILKYRQNDDKESEAWIDNENIDVLIKYFINYHRRRVQLRTNPLNISCSMGDVKKTKTLVGTYNPEAFDKNGLTPIHEACYYGHLDIVQYFSDMDLNMNILSTEKNTPLHEAVIMNQKDVIDFLLGLNVDASVKNKYDKTAFEYATKPMLKWLQDEKGYMDSEEEEDEEEEQDMENYEDDGGNAGLSREEKKLMQMIASYEKIALFQNRRSPQKKLEEVIDRRKRKWRVLKVPEEKVKGKPGRKKKVVEATVGVESTIGGSTVLTTVSTSVSTSVSNSKSIPKLIPKSPIRRSAAESTIRRSSRRLSVKEEMPLLHKYTLEGNYDMVKTLLEEHSATESYNDETPLFIAVYQGYIEIVKLMIQSLNDEHIDFEELVRVSKKRGHKGTTIFLNELNSLRRKCLALPPKAAHKLWRKYITGL